MSDSLRQRIVDAFLTRLRTIRTMNGYQTEVGASVHEWRVTGFELDELPALNLRDTEDVAALSVAEDVHALKIEVEAYVAGTTAPATLRQILADLIQAIGTDPTFGGLAQDTNVTAEAIDVRQEEKRIAAVQVSFEVQFTTAHLNAYT